jgi:uncharacterized protein (DUF302 family)
MSDVSYGLVKHLAGVPFDEAVRRSREALEAEGFGILTEIDVRATLKKKIDVDYRPYLILGACNPKLAHQGLEADAHLGLLLPCNVVVQSMDGGTEVSIMDPGVLSQVSHAPGLEAVAAEARRRLDRVLAAL